MPRCLTRISLALILMLSSEVWALGLGEVRLESALNQPLRAEIELLAASAEELSDLRVAMASSETFARYGIDRPFYLQEVTFEIVRSGRADGNFIRVRTPSPITEPFLTFLVEASWSRGRLLREYTVLLDPPTFAPSADSVPQVTAPSRPQPSDAGRIERTPPQQRPAPAQQPRTQPAPATTRPAQPQPRPAEPKPEPVQDNTPFDSAAGGDVYVSRGDTLWGIAMANRPDSRLTINQTMLAIYEANPGAFSGNINILREGASLRMPSADDIYSIDRRDANSEVVRQHNAWGGSAPVDTTETTPTLTLVPPDEDTTDVYTGIDSDYGAEPLTRDEEITDRIAEIEAADVPIQQSLIDVRDNELAALRQELAEIRGEIYEPPLEDVVDDPFVDAADDTDIGEFGEDELGDEQVTDDELFPDFDDVIADDTDAAPADDAVTDTDTATTTDTAADDTTTTRRRPEPSFLDQAMGYLTSIWGLIGGALLLVIGVLFWFMRRGGGTEEPEAWGGALDADDVGGDTLSGTETLRAPDRDDESFVVVEQDSAITPPLDDTIETPAAAEIQVDEAAETGSFGSLEDTFSSDTAINLDQSDPIAEADFHMAYGLYDQAADLINGALQIEPQRQDLLTKLCEIYFVWGNRDAFIDSADRLQGVTGGESADWDKIVIMGQQIAADHHLFAGAGVAGATKAVDLSFEADMGETGSLDMDLGGAGAADDVIDLGADVSGSDDGVDFLFDDEATSALEGGDEETLDFSVTAEMPTVEQLGTEPTVEMEAQDPTVETPTIEDQFPGFDSTAELPSIPDDVGDAIAGSGPASGATAEINLDDLGLDLGDLDETEVASLDDLDATGTNEILGDELSAVTGKNPQIDPNATGVQPGLDPASLSEGLGFDDLAETAEMRLAADETGQNPMMDTVDNSTDAVLEQELLEATGHTQVLPEDLAVETITEDDGVLSDDDATMLAPGYGGDADETVLAPTDDDDDFDFAKTEALPPEAFTGDTSLDETGEMPAVASTDMDLDLDDLTAALAVSEMGDTVDMPREDATVEQPRPSMGADTVELSPDDLSDDLDEARTMTEVGTKLDLARAYVDMGDPQGARSILEEVLDEGDESQRQQAQQLLDSLPS